MTTDCSLQTHRDKDRLCLVFQGSWTIHTPPCAIPDIHTLFTFPAKTLYFNTDNLEDWDSRLLIELSRIIDFAGAQSMAVDDQGLPPGVRNILNLTRKNRDLSFSAKISPGSFFLTDIGNSTLKFFRQSQEMLVFTGEIILAYTRFFLGRARFLKEDFFIFSMTVAHSHSPSLP